MKKFITSAITSITLAVLISSNISSVFGQANSPDKTAQGNVALAEARNLVKIKKRENIEKALVKYKEAQEFFRQANNLSGIAKTYLGQGFASDLLNRKSQAIDFYEKALVIFREISDKSGESTALNNIGLFYYNAGDYKKALKYLEEALPLRRESGNINGEVLTTNMIGSLYNSMGEREKALAFYQKALITLDKIKENTAFKLQNNASIFSNIGRTYSDLGVDQKALEYFQKALPLYRESKDNIGVIIVLVNIGQAENALGNKEKALNFYNESLKLQKEAGIETFLAPTLTNIGFIYAESGEFEKAIEKYETALALQRRLRIPIGELASLNNLGKIFIDTNQTQKAIKYLNKALLISHEIDNKAYRANLLHNLRKVWQKKGNKQVAVFYGKQSVNKFQELRRSIKGLSRSIRIKYLQSVEDAYRELADLLIETQNFAQAEQVLRMLKEEEYFDFVRRDEKVNEVFAKKLSFNETEQKLIEQFEILLKEFVESKRNFSKHDKDKISADASQRGEEYILLSEKFKEAENRLKNFVENEITAKVNQKTSGKFIFDTDLQAKVKLWKKGTVVLHTVLAKDRYRIVLTTADKQIDGKTEISALELNKKIFNYRNTLQNIKLDPRPLGKELYDILIKPIEKDLEAANAKTLVWSLDGTLRYIPIATLSPDGRSYLIEKYQNVIITPKTREDISDLDTEWRALGLGVSESQVVANPDGSDSQIEFSSIPGTQKELLEIIRDEEKSQENGILNGKRFLNSQFTKQNLAQTLLIKNTAGQRKYTAVHIASHFRLGNNWTSSFLLLGNGEVLTLKELINSPELDFSDVELVTLSACDTAAATDANGKEVDSLANVIQAKNGKAVLAALWSVADESTPLLMSEFYRLRKDNPKMTKAEAMQKVQKAFISGELKPSAEYTKKLLDYYESFNSSENDFVFNKNTPFSHPYFWSPFVLIGNWR